MKNKEATYKTLNFIHSLKEDEKNYVLKLIQDAADEKKRLKFFAVASILTGAFLIIFTALIGYIYFNMEIVVSALLSVAAFATLLSLTGNTKEKSLLIVLRSMPLFLIACIYLVRGARMLETELTQPFLYITVSLCITALMKYINMLAIVHMEKVVKLRNEFTEILRHYGKEEIITDVGCTDSDR